MNALRIRRTLLSAACVTALSATMTTGMTGVAGAEDGDPWSCSHGSEASGADAGGRDSWATHKDPDNGDRVGMTFTAHGEKIMQWNDSNDTAYYHARFFKGNKIVKTWFWTLEPGEADYTRAVSAPEGHKVQLEINLHQPSKGACFDNGGIA